MFFNMGISLHFWQTENETGKELRSSEKHNLCMRFLVSQWYPMFGNLRMRVPKGLEKSG